MGRGDNKTKKGKRFSGSYGKLRPRNPKKNILNLNSPNAKKTDSKKTKESESKKKSVSKT